MDTLNLCKVSIFIKLRVLSNLMIWLFSLMTKTRFSRLTAIPIIITNTLIDNNPNKYSTVVCSH